MCGVEVVVVAARVVGDDDVWRWYVVVDRAVGELFGDACRCVPCFGRGVVEHEDVEGPRIVGRDVEGGRGGWMGRPLKCAKAGLWRAAVSLTTDSAQWGGTPTCCAMAATAWATALRSGRMPGWSAGGCRPPSGAGWCHHRV